MILTAHQPCYLPWLGLFNKILQSDRFIFLDDVKFKNSAWHARTIIKNHEDHIIQLTIPCSNTCNRRVVPIKRATRSSIRF